MDRLRFEGFGIRMTGWECHRKADGKMAWSTYVASRMPNGVTLTIIHSHDTQKSQLGAPMNVPTFAQFNAKAFKAMNKAYGVYAKHLTSLEQGEGTTSGPIPETFKANTLKMNDAGLPLVPDILQNDQGRETAAMQASMIRIYWTKHYGMVN